MRITQMERQGAGPPPAVHPPFFAIQAAETWTTVYGSTRPGTKGRKLVYVDVELNFCWQSIKIWNKIYSIWNWKWILI